jgi:hypothetical protein
MTAITMTMPLLGVIYTHHESWGGRNDQCHARSPCETSCPIKINQTPTLQDLVDLLDELER